MGGVVDRLTLLVVDANVLIDWVSVDREVLALVSRHVARVLVPTAVLREVVNVTQEEASALGLEVIDATDAHLAEAAASLGGRCLRQTGCAWRSLGTPTRRA